MSASPAVTAARPSGLVDFRKHAEYPIVLGDSLKDDASAERLIDLRFNWQPKAGLEDYDSQFSMGKDGYSLQVTDPVTSDSAFRYSGHDRNNGDDMSSFVLIFDRKRSAFVLENVAHSIDLNLESAASQSKDDIRRRPRLPDGPPRQSSSGGKKAVDDDEPDPSNPFDFRNFLDEAKVTAEKTAGSRSPLPGSRTPLSGFASPAAGPSRFTPTTTPALPQKEARPVQRKPKAEPPARKPKTAQKPAKQVPLSSERISDSDDELSDSVAVSKESKPAAVANKGHTRNTSASHGQSPHIVVNDGDLEIDMGSPPTQLRHRKRQIDAEAFRSHTGTPVIGNSPRQQTHAAPDIEMKDVNGQDEDGDVEELNLDSPQALATAVTIQEHAPTPPNQAASEDDEVAELEDLLGGDDDEHDTSGQGVGLGITRPADDDSEESEEE
ncbi:uncharacterized protein HMPREF1541_08960 [Cyphellophora europaea CBS 101466]|uniref:Transcription elongation factor Eaf N-terminal domain-containing protein n=1 Tax=Cyphellophora europaea (strain CBS 101466) TaxID=1220924 RepID=W2RJK5_CYPE1|nr:uncharacterized protein HMPREF1541_08960 [Cyphellophora europaea CBS 101466]ETN36682.1 hypothetical protein HMPREF1541_08960 [Cyphellophora europaea CBS 101466]